MAFYKNSNYGSNNYTPVNYGNRYYGQSRYGSSNFSNAKRKSGARLGTTKNGNLYVSGWFARRDTGLISIFAVESKKSKEYENNLKQEGITLFCEVTYKKTGNVVKGWAMFNKVSKVLVFRDLNIMVSVSKNWAGFVPKKR